jgi:ubiquinone/menaquinone biosynthesis C-methylase UbiE
MSQRLLRERRFHDRQAADRARALTLNDYRVDDESYLRHESWMAPAFDALGEVRGQRVLDVGCGHGMASVVLARRGAIVTACDLSLGYVREAGRRARANGVDLTHVVCDAEYLPFADESFDRIWGNAILHHLDLKRAAGEIRRVLKPGGNGVFCEPWGGNRWLNWARRTLTYPGKHRTADESPLGARDMKLLRRVFPRMQVRGHQFLAMFGRLLPRARNWLGGCDKVLLGQFPAWQRYCRYVTIMIEK